MQGGRLHLETMKDLNTVRVTPLRKGTKGKIRPITIGATIRRFGLSAILKVEKSIQKTVSPQEFAIGRKAALEDLKRTVDTAIAKTQEEHGRAVVFQLDCSCAFNRVARQTALLDLKERAPHLMVPLGQWLTQPMTHIVKKEDGATAKLITTDGLSQGCPSAPLLFSLATDAPEFYGKQARHPTFARLQREGRANIQIMRYMDDITIVT
jgi:hypothetical protein